MAKQVVERTDAVTLLLTNQNVDLQRQVTDLRREIENLRQENKILYQFMERPSIATMHEDQVSALAELLFQRIMRIPVKKEEAS